MFHHYFSQIGLASPLSLTRIELAPIARGMKKKKSFLFIVFANFIRLLDLCPSPNVNNIPNASRRVIFYFEILTYIYRAR